MSTITTAGKIVGTATLALGTFVTGLHVAGGSSDAAPASAHTAASTTCTAVPQLSDKARAAIKAARAEPAGKQRAAALKKVHDDIAKGTYGASSESAESRRTKLRASAPDSLKTALQAVRKLPESQRKQARQDLRKDMLAGKYGDVAKQIAESAATGRDTCAQERTKARVEKCTARAQNGTQDGDHKGTQKPQQPSKQDDTSSTKSS